MTSHKSGETPECAISPVATYPPPAEANNTQAQNQLFTKVRIVFSKVLTEFSKVLTVFTKVLSVKSDEIYRPAQHPSVSFSP